MPHFTFLVIDAMTGQDAVATAEAFHETLDLDGVILTKLDGDARGGAALSVKEVVGRPIAFASTGERLADFDQFHPDRMASRILGMGDVLSLIEQAEREFDGDVAQQGAERLLEGRFTLEDFLSQLQQVKKLGSLGGILSLLPGVPKELKQANANIDDGQITQVEAIIQSMTRKERADPALIDGGRRRRIATGSGTTIQDVNQLLRQFKDAQQLMRSPGMLGGMLGGRGGGRARPGPGRARWATWRRWRPGGLDALGEIGTGLPGGSSAPRGRGGGGLKGAKGAKKKKGGGRVTPKAGGRVVGACGGPSGPFSPPGSATGHNGRSVPPGACAHTGRTGSHQWP